MIKLAYFIHSIALTRVHHAIPFLDFVNYDIDITHLELVLVDEHLQFLQALIKFSDVSLSVNLNFRELWIRVVKLAAVDLEVALVILDHEYHEIKLYRAVDVFPHVAHLKKRSKKDFKV